MNNIKLITKELHYEARSNSVIHIIIRDLLEVANDLQITCIAKFNNVEIKAEPNGNEIDILNQWQDDIDAR